MAQANLAGNFYPIENIFCIGRNYSEHIKELNHKRDKEITAFLKPTASVLNLSKLDENQTLSASAILPTFSKEVHFEVEVLLLIGENADSLTEKNALDIIAGIGIGLDLTARDVQNYAKKEGLPWLKAKGFKQSACISDFVSKQTFGNSENLVSNLANLEFSLKQNSELKQSGNTKDMLYSFSEILQFLAEVYGLQKGDLIFTGTPAGVGKLQSGDKLELSLADVIKANLVVA